MQMLILLALTIGCINWFLLRKRNNILRKIQINEQAQIPRLVHKVNNLEIYSVGNVFYWKDNESPQGCGPFPTVFAATLHYDRIVKAFNNNLMIITPLDKVIKVNFITKKRE